MSETIKIKAIPIQAHLKIVLMADDIVVAEYHNQLVWNRVLQEIIESKMEEPNKLTK